MSTDSIILKAALEAKTSADFAALETLIGSGINLKWRPVGDIEDNFGAINAASDARLALNERITNMIDAVLEMHARLKFGTDVAGMAAAMTSPAQAATVLLGVPAAGVGELKIPDRQKLAEEISIDFMESGVAERPTAVMRDGGIGQTPSRLPETILSIHRGNKRDKPFLMGVYGWGGSNALCFAEGGTVVVSRRHPQLLDGEADGVAVTIVKGIYTEDMRTPAYFYAVDRSNNVPSLDVAAADELGLAHGTQITHIEYDLAIKGPLLNQYKYYNAALYEPVVPYYLGSNRDIDKTPGRRTMVGVGGALKSRGDDENTKGTKIAYSNRATIDLGDDGEVRTHVWVLDKNGARPGADTTSAFVDADSAIVVTLNGQRQDSEKREWIKRVCKYPHLYTRMIVEVEADFLRQDAKIKAFASTRERLRGSMHQRIFKELADLLTKDEELQRLQETLREESLKDTASKASEKDLRKLAKIIGKLGGRTAEVDVEVEVDADGPKNKGGGGGTPRNTDDSHLPELPTKLEFAPHALTVTQGGTKKRLMVEIDAKNGYLPDHDTDLTITVEGPAGETKDVFPTTRAQVLGGMAQWLVAASEDAELGDYKLTARLRVPGGELSDTVEIAVIAPREPNDGGSSRTGGKKVKRIINREQPVGPQVSWVEREKWDTYRFDARSVGKVDDSGKGVDIYLNLDFDKLQEVLNNPSYTSAVQEARKSAYMIPTALGLYRVHEMEQKNELSEDLVKQIHLIVADSVLVATDTDGILGESIDDDD